MAAMKNQGGIILLRVILRGPFRAMESHGATDRVTYSICDSTVESTMARTTFKISRGVYPEA